jgi:hypothetical protein
MVIVSSTGGLTSQKYVKGGNLRIYWNNFQLYETTGIITFIHC